MNWEKKYTEWIDSPYTPLEMKKKILESNEELLQESFEKQLDFGTGGMRGIIGFGTNRMNVLVVRRVTLSLGIYLKELNSKNKEGVVIQYDTRFKSKEFAEVAASTLAGQGIKVYLSDAPRPTPLLSYLVREKNAIAGIMITASHNPPEYNGYKVYNSEGGQILPDYVERITDILGTIPTETGIKPSNLGTYIKNGGIVYYGEEMEYSYIKSLQDYTSKFGSTISSSNEMSIVYTPLHGTGTSLMLNTLNHFGFNNVTLVEEQATYDGTFSTVKSPNPEEIEAFDIGIKKAIEVNADLIFATDPDSDRLGVVVRTSGVNFEYLSGNQLGAILINYLLKNSQYKEGVRVLKTIVTSDFGAAIAESYNCEVIETLTGFKYIGDIINNNSTHLEEDFLMGYEESCGFLVYPLSRDKDAIQTGLLIAQIASYYKQFNKTLIDVLEELQEQYGFYSDYLHTISFENDKEYEEIKSNIEDLYENPPLVFRDEKVILVENYETGYRKKIDNNTFERLNLPEAGVMKFILSNGSWFAIRMSGTENKCKVYFSAVGISQQESQAKLQVMKKTIINYF